MNDYKRQLQYIKDALAESVLKASDKEIIEEIKAEGKDPEKEAEKVRKVLLNEVEKFKENAWIKRMDIEEEMRKYREAIWNAIQDYEKFKKLSLKVLKEVAKSIDLKIEK